MLGFKRGSFLLKKAAAMLAVIFFVNSVMPAPLMAQALATLPAPGTRVGLSAQYSMTTLCGIKVDRNNPLMFDFIVDKGDASLEGQELKSEGEKLIKYFLTALTVPEKELWVNLSPYEPDRIVPERFGQTEMGRDLLAQDYILKQLTASLSYPESQLGKAFWQRVYDKLQARLGTTDIPADTFNKVWIMPDKAVVYEKGSNVFIVQNRLKVLMDKDYLATENNKGSVVARAGVVDPKDSAAASSDAVREILIPELTREVNEGKNFANLRQVYSALLLAAWYRGKVKESILGSVYLDKNKTAGSEIADRTEKEQIYQKYVAAFKKGAYNYIKEDIDRFSGEPLPRKYFSGGAVGAYPDIERRSDFAGAPGVPSGRLVDFAASVETAGAVAAENGAASKTYVAKPEGIEAWIQHQLQTPEKVRKTTEYDVTLRSVGRFIQEVGGQFPADFKSVYVIDDVSADKDAVFTFGLYYNKITKVWFIQKSFLDYFDALYEKKIAADPDNRELLLEEKKNWLPVWAIKALTGKYKLAYDFLKQVTESKDVAFPNGTLLKELLEINRNELVGSTTPEGLAAFKARVAKNPVLSRMKILEPAEKTFAFLKEMFASLEEALYALELLMMAGITRPDEVIRVADGDPQFTEEQKGLMSRIGMLAFAANPPTQAHYVVAMLWAMVEGKMSKMIARVTDGDYRKKFLQLSYEFRMKLAQQLEKLSGGLIKVMPPIKMKGLNGEEVVPIILQLNNGKQMILFYGNGDDHYFVFVLDKDGNPQWEKPSEDNVYYASMEGYPALLKLFLDTVGQGLIGEKKFKLLNSLIAELEKNIPAPGALGEEVLAAKLRRVAVIYAARSQGIEEYIPKLDVQGKLALHKVGEGQELANVVGERTGVDLGLAASRQREDVNLETVIIPGLSQDVSSTILREAFYRMAVYNELDLNALAAVPWSILEMIVSEKFLPFFRMLVRLSDYPLLPTSIESLVSDDFAKFQEPGVKPQEEKRQQKVLDEFNGYLTEGWAQPSLQQKVIEVNRVGNQTEVRIVGPGNKVFCSMRFGIWSSMKPKPNEPGLGTEEIWIGDDFMNHELLKNEEEQSPGFSRNMYWFMVQFIQKWSGLPNGANVDYKKKLMEYLSNPESSNLDELKEQSATRSPAVLAVFASDDIQYYRNVLMLYAFGIGDKIVIIGGADKYKEPLKALVRREGIRIEGKSQSGMVWELLQKLAGQMRLDFGSRPLRLAEDETGNVVLDDQAKDLLGYMTRLKEIIQTKDQMKVSRFRPQIRIIVARGPQESLRTASVGRFVFRDDPKVQLISYHGQEDHFYNMPTEALVVEMLSVLAGIAGGYLAVTNRMGDKGFASIEEKQWQYALDAFKMLPKERRKVVAKEFQLYVFQDQKINHPDILDANGQRPGLWESLIHKDGKKYLPQDLNGRLLAQDKKTGAADFLIAVLKEMDAAENVDAAASTGTPGTLRGGIDMDLSNMDLDVQSEGPGITFTIDPAMLRNGDFNGLVPVIRSITPITNLPVFLGAESDAPRPKPLAFHTADELLAIIDEECLLV